MKSCLKMIMSWLLVITLVFNMVVFSSGRTRALASSFIEIKEGRLAEKSLKEQNIEEHQLLSTYIIENLIYEDGLYEYKLSEDTICQAYIIEVTVGVTSIEQILSQMPAGIIAYDIDWQSVIAKFAVGTTIVIAVGVINYFTQGSTYFVFGSPRQVARDALIGGAIGASLNTLLHSRNSGKQSDAAVLKYSIEGFADGYMWGAISSTLRIANENYRRLRAFKTATGGTLRISIDGSVLDDAGHAIGKAYYSSDQSWYLVNETTNSVRFFDHSGAEIIGSTSEAYLSQVSAGLPSNSTLRLGTGSNYHICRTDAKGVIYRIDDNLVPNTQYELNGYHYSTDALGRIEMAEFDQLVLKPQGRGRLPIEDGSAIIGHGEWISTDQRGHLIADRFGGDNTMANIVPQAGHVNQGQIAEIENELFRAVSEGNQVSGSVIVTYKGRSYRPISFTYKYDIGEGLVTKTILN